jgi:hypothetical protein
MNLVLLVVLLAQGGSCIDREAAVMVAAWGDRFKNVRQTPQARALQRQLFLEWAATTKCGADAADALRAAASSENPTLYLGTIK